VRGNLEAFSCKLAGLDKKLSRSLEDEVAAARGSPAAAEALGKSPVGPLADSGSRRTLVYLILTLNHIYPDYDFSLLRAHHFRKEAGAGAVDAAVEAHLFEAGRAWEAAPGRAEETAARLAALGVERGGGAAADALFALAKAAESWETIARGEASVETLARAVAAAPLGLATARKLAHKMAVTDSRAAYQVALRASRRADDAGLAFAGAHLLIAVANALAHGALGPGARCGALRPLLEGARRRLEAARRDVPRAEWLRVDEFLRGQETAIAGVADSALFGSSNVRLVFDERPARTCARCDERLLEALLCSRCGASYCSQACQKAHWPEHKAACKAARRGG